ncbi:heme ABC exporter ATP-binding protein CcmA [Caballeronia insecticola]|uniref:Cytochrome c biogenesis ATP-binding export protein CcmA n=1 Tax=Caballeronia insecticola TaxID=758793 RepID=R4WU19_9BURK|nr:heme ABC exporter ATP-binding protein CcmA [Caballeronia insecticola]BAN28098.1 cytochrome c biogenesis ATP-binding export protein CcmA [Caballeronia insecticola]
MLSARQLDIMRGQRTIVAGVDLHVDGGAALVIHGANGSGKSSLIAALAGLLPPVAGHVMWRGADVRDDPARFRRDLAYLGHADGFNGDLSVAENLRFAALIGAHVAKAVQHDGDVLDQAGILPLLHVSLNRLSQGQRRRVALARLVLANKPLWLLDEPTDALDDTGATWFASCIDDHLRAGGTLVATTHRPLLGGSGHARHLHLARSAA